jgi:hypothetical protein
VISSSNHDPWTVEYPYSIPYSNYLERNAQFMLANRSEEIDNSNRKRLESLR